MKSRLLALTSAFVVLLGGMVVSTAPAQALAIKIGVAPSPNGLVMANVPTQIAVNQNATVYRQAAGKWVVVGKATKATAVPYTFTESGIQNLRVKTKKASKVFKVSVFGTFNGWSESSPINFNGTVLNGRERSAREETYTRNKTNDCRFVDVGSKQDKGSTVVVDVASSGANPTMFTAGPEGLAVLNIPVAGDAVVTIKPERQGGFGTPDMYVAVIWTCLN